MMKGMLQNNVVVRKRKTRAAAAMRSGRSRKQKKMEWTPSSLFSEKTYS
jgi:hypothetical protein